MFKQPLADKLRPTNLNDVVGQTDLVAKDGTLRKIVERNQISSFIFYGPPGTGKTTVAKIIANQWKLPTAYFNAAVDNKAKLQKVINRYPDQTVALILDEIHRLTKPMQDFLLPYSENGHLLILGATTENPQITVAPAIRSRCLMFEFKPVQIDDLIPALKRAYQLFNEDDELSDSIYHKIAETANGDVRTALNILETLHTIKGSQITVADIKQYAGSNHFVFDKDSNFHYDTISALQKSIRGWDTDAALYYTALMCHSGDLKTLIRRLKVIAYEDIGLADPAIAQQAVTALMASEDLGLPEAEIPIGNAVILLCNARHSNSAHDAIHAAMAVAEANQAHSIPYALRDTHYSGADRLGHGVGYKYPHDFPNDWIAQQYLPDDLIHTQFYIPKNLGQETAIGNEYQALKQLQFRKLGIEPFLHPIKPK